MKRTSNKAARGGPHNRSEKSRQSRSGTKRKQRSGIGLCLSGGGFRAALFHLGALRRLHELGVLEELSTISSVSGGSIISGFIAHTMAAKKKSIAELKFEEDIARPFRRLTTHDFRTFPFLTHFLWNWLFPSFRVRHLIRLLKRRLSSLPLCGIPLKPEFTFCATDMKYGVNWKFTQHTTGDYRTGYMKTPASMLLVDAVAASACFPPVFGPLTLTMNPGPSRKKGSGPKTGRSGINAGCGNSGRICLTDGGIYDNLGLEPVLDTHSHILVSDCGSPIPFEVKRNILSRTFRYVSLIMKQVEKLRREILMSAINEDYVTCRCDAKGKALYPVDKARGAYWAITSDAEGYNKRKTATSKTAVFYSRDFVKQIISCIRTDLDRFTKTETAVCENHGYSLADVALRTFVPELIKTDVPFRWPHKDYGPDTEKELRKKLKDSHRRLCFFRPE